MPPVVVSEAQDRSLGRPENDALPKQLLIATLGRRVTSLSLGHFQKTLLRSLPESLGDSLVPRLSLEPPGKPGPFDTVRKFQ
jgi:hypothetical protein